MISRIIFTTFLTSFWGTCDVSASSRDILFSGDNMSVVDVSPEKSTGIDDIYVVRDLMGVTISVLCEQFPNAKWYRFSNGGTDFMQPIENMHEEGGKYTLFNIDSDCGYLIKSDKEDYVFWIVDYSKYVLKIDNISLGSNQDCETTILSMSGDASPIYYYTVGGRREVLSRDVEVSYYNLEWNGEETEFKQRKVTKQYASLSDVIYIVPPLYCSSRFEISGDRFLKAWNEECNYESSVLDPTAIAVETSAECLNDDSFKDNTIKDDSSDLGGSAPCDMLFTAYVTDGVRHIEWQIADDAEFENISHRITRQDVEHTFKEEGTSYVRCVVSNADGSCEKYGDTYIVNIGSSQLKIPNIFTPDGDGINDEWKVAYRSLTDFRCWIFDRQGHELFYFDNPSMGWDGKSKDGSVRSGVYYYVIKATGSDGKRYNKSGDINILLRNGSRN